MKPLLWGEPPAGCVPAPGQDSPGFRIGPGRWHASCRRRGGNLPAPACPRRGKRERGRFKFLAAAGGFHPPLVNTSSCRDLPPRPPGSTDNPMLHFPVKFPLALSVPPCFHTHSCELAAKIALELGASCYSVGPGLLSLYRPLPQASQPAVGLPRSRSHPDNRLRQSVAVLPTFQNPPQG